MNTDLLNIVEAKYLKNRPDVQVGDTVKLSMVIAEEGGKERIQVFEGFVIAIKGSGMGKTITVRKLSNGVGVERIVPMNAPTLQQIEIIKRAKKVRKAKLYYMRDRIGKKAMKINGGVDEVYMVDEVAPAPEVVAEESTTTEA